MKSRPRPRGASHPQQHVGAGIRRLRTQQSRTQQELADTCGFTKSLLCKIETGKVQPPVATLVKIAAALGTSVAALIEQRHGVRAVFEPASTARNGTTRTEKGYAVFPFASGFGSKRMQPFLFVAKRGEVKRHSLTHQGEEFIHVLAGELRFVVGGVDYRMAAGDSLYFSALEPHEVIPVSATVSYLDIFV
jgi:transcriptional regulator with XRE-family HTH domain